MATVTLNLDLVAKDASSAIRQLAASLANHPGVINAAQLEADVLAREAVVPTFLGHGLALPHARTDAVTTRVIAAGRSLPGVPFGAQGELANLILLIGCPRLEINAYLAFSRQILGHLRHGPTREELLFTANKARFLQLLDLTEESTASGSSAP